MEKKDMVKCIIESNMDIETKIEIIETLYEENIIYSYPYKYPGVVPNEAPIRYLKNKPWCKNINNTLSSSGVPLNAGTTLI